MKLVFHSPNEAVTTAVWAIHLSISYQPVWLFVHFFCKLTSHFLAESRFINTVSIWVTRILRCCSWSGRGWFVSSGHGWYGSCINTFLGILFEIMYLQVKSFSTLPVRRIRHSTMAKRSAATELTDRNWDQEEEPEEVCIIFILWYMWISGVYLGHRKSES